MTVAPLGARPRAVPLALVPLLLLVPFLALPARPVAAQGCASYAGTPPIALSELALPGTSHALAVQGNHAYVTDLSGGLRIVDVSDPLAPVPLGRVGPYGECVAVDGNLALVGEAWTCAAVDVSDPLRPVIRSEFSLDSYGYVAVAALDGDRGYVAVDYEIITPFWAGLYVVDLEDPAAPRTLGVYQYDGGAGRILARGDVLFVSGAWVSPEEPRPDQGGWAYLFALDVSDLAAPAQVGRIGAPYEEAGALAIEGTIACVGVLFVSGKGGLIENSLRVIDVSDPAHLVELGRVATTGRVTKLALRGGIAYALVADIWHEPGRLEVFDLHDPSAPARLGQADLPPMAHDLALGPGGAWLTCGEQGLKLLPRECSATVPVVVSSFTAEPIAGGVDVHWRTAEPHPAAGDLRLTGSRDGEAWGVPVRALGAGWFVAEDRDPRLRDGGLIAYRLDLRTGQGTWELLRSASLELPPAAARPPALRASPNPFNPTTVLAFTLDRPAPVRLTVHDLAGRALAVLADRAFAPGAHGVTWDGRDRTGRLLPSGSYVVRLQAGDRTARCWLTVLR